jgi:hypothetical protein
MFQYSTAVAARTCFEEKKAEAARISNSKIFSVLLA